MATYYWKGGSGDWSDPAHWGLLPTGSVGGAGVPDSTIDAVFNSASSAGAYVVSLASGEACKSLTTAAPAAGTLTFNGVNEYSSISAYGNINVHAACLWTSVGSSTTGNITLNQYDGSSCTFNSSGANTKLITFTAYVGQTYSFCTSTTQTFQEVSLQTYGVGPDLSYLGANITIDGTVNPNKTGDSFYTNSWNSVNATSSTINLGKTGATRNTGSVYFNAPITGGSNVNVLCVYTSGVELRGGRFGNVASSAAANTGTVITVNGYFGQSNLTLGTLTGAAGEYSIQSAYTTDTITVTSINTRDVVFNTASILVCGAVAIAANTVPDTTTGFFYNQGNATLGAVTMGSNTTFQTVSPTSSSDFATVSCLSFSSVGAVGVTNYVYVASMTNSGSTTLTNCYVTPVGSKASYTGGGTGWTQTGASTFTATSNPTSVKSVFYAESFTSGTGAILFTSTEVRMYNQNTSGYGLQSSAKVIISGTAAGGVPFDVEYSTNGVLFAGGATLTTWADVAVNVYGPFSVSGAGGFTLSDTFASVLSISTFKSFGGTFGGPVTLNISDSLGDYTGDRGFTQGTLTCSSSLTVNINALAGQDTVNFILPDGTIGGGTFNRGALSIYGTIVCSGAFTYTGGGTNNGISGFSLTVGGLATFTNPVTFTWTELNINNGASITSATMLDNAVNSSVASIVTLTSSGSSFVMNNVRLKVQNDVFFYNTVGLVNSAGFYLWGDARFTDIGTTNTANTFYPIVLPFSGSLTLAGTSGFFNTYIAADSITAVGNATYKFLYSLNAPATGQVTGDYENSVEYGYPQIAFNTFTVTAGSTNAANFAISGGGAANIRTLIRPYSFSNTSTATMSVDLIGTTNFTDVDFWRIVPSGASAKPWVGTRLGNVGTLPNITTATPKTVYWVGGGSVNWNSANWATTSGGVGSLTNYPLPQDSVIFDDGAALSNEITISTPTFVKNLTYSNSTKTSYVITSAYASNLYITGNFEVQPQASNVCGFDGDYAVNGIMKIVFADGASSETSTATMNGVAKFTAQICFATLGTTNFVGSWGINIGGMEAYSTNDYATRYVNINCTQFGTAYNAPAQASDTFTIQGGTFNFNAATIASSIILFGTDSPTTISETAYNLNATSQIQIFAETTTRNFGNISFYPNPYGGSPNWTFYNYTSATCKFIGLTCNLSYDGQLSTNSASTYQITNPMVVNRLGAYPSIFTWNGGNCLFVKLGGGTVSITGAANISGTNVSPSATWYAPTANIYTSTGWNNTSAPVSKGGFLLFQ